ncbi:hypothetical protein Sjap_024276 [Stephania japonica]|uniref:Uncharacterized protein n=1 Tax=Stephania japonica TaxID=461633 RepID=A0AAP0EDB0_9MAGN
MHSMESLTPNPFQNLILTYIKSFLSFFLLYFPRMLAAVDAIDPLVSKSSINNKEIKKGGEVVPLLSLNPPLALLFFTWVFNKIGARVFFDFLK